MSYNTDINWDLFFNQVDLIYDDKPIFIKNFLPNPKNFITWDSVNTILNNSSLEWRIIENNSSIQIPTYKPFTGGIFQDKKFIQNHINKGNTFIIENYVIYNEFVKSLLSEIEKYLNIVAGAHIFGSKNKKETVSYPPHIDDNPLFIFNIEGITKWNLFSNNSSFLFNRDEINKNVQSNKLVPHSEYILAPGDFLYIPTRVFHKATPNIKDSYRLSLNIATFLNMLDFKIDKNYYQI